ncbi:MAG: GDP-L-fucose synthase [Sporomusaceae bacterium]|nr:GDP-L-fucose synthase [Sporomusaceae bacterium]
MRILLTGATGMVGKNFLEHSMIKKFEVLNPSHCEMDLENYSAVLSYLMSKKPDIIIHAAGKVGGIQANIAQPVDFLVKNLDMARNLILAAREANIKRFLNLASSCMYPRNCSQQLTESMILKGELEPTNEGYALAKIVATRLCEYIVRENSCYEYKTILPCNLYGRWDKYDENHGHMIPAVIAKLHRAVQTKEISVPIWGDGTARREFMSAADLADFLVYAVQNFSELPYLMNVGLGYDYTVKEYYETIAAVVGYKGSFTYDLTKPSGMQRKLLDVSNQTIFGWRPKISLQDGISQAYQFYLERIATA